MSDLTARTSAPAPHASLAGLGSLFLDPGGANLQEVRQLLHQTVDLITGELTEPVSLPPVPLKWSKVSAENLIPGQAVPDSDLLQACRDLVRGSMNPAHPRYLGHMDPLASVSSVMASLVTAAVNNNMLSREMSPIFSDLEQRLLRELAGLFGLPKTAGGMLQSGGTLCNLQALTLARNSHFDIHRTGLSTLKQQPVLFASELCHSSIQKAAMILGLGTSAVIPIHVDANNRMSAEALNKAVQMARKNGQQPFAVVATAGTTVTGNIDPLPEVAEICQQNNLWFHVDASYGGAIIFSDQHRHRLAGIDRADSITFNPQKWCYVTKACALVMFRDEQVLDRHFRISAPYMSLNEAEGERNLGEWGVQGTRAPDIAKWWLTLLQFGRSGLETLVNHSYELTELFLEQIRQRPFLELASTPDMNIFCFRDRRFGADEISLGKANARLQERLLKDDETFFSLPHFRESRWLKAVILNPYTTKADVERIFRFIDDHK
ncbi:pyridoxal phosphate-dependent decarboxylase family protein [Rubinisphaera margarita]|uniref:pyridoxal phosphate-dependent decarboxylase family protein n=1 Tax=Rubinisphaera margarita TaxID=2909586 RepID=UPI001EE8D018|nr:pyridoxal-dependent decarboxylase [Rubinisphaera margarita]MCG6155386.1 pyridoxal-dependent decarboxylase [Rubinisphaera margarita]